MEYSPKARVDEVMGCAILVSLSVKQLNSLQIKSQAFAPSLETFSLNVLFVPLSHSFFQNFSTRDWFLFFVFFIINYTKY